MAAATNKSKPKTSKKQAALQTRREVTGVCLVALGLFFAVSIYSDAVGIVGSVISDAFFGIFGIAGYVVPVLVFALGIAVIAMAKKKTKTSSFVLSAIGVYSLLVLIHTYCMNDIGTTTALQYYKGAYTLGELSRLGGGVLGALLAYPALLLIGAVGTYIFFGALVLICILVVTKLSLRSAAEQVGSTIKNSVDDVMEHIEARRGELYTEDLAAPIELRQTTKRRGARSKQTSKQTNIIEPPQYPQPNDFNKAKYVELDILPSTGTIRKKGDLPVNGVSTTAPVCDIPVVRSAVKEQPAVEKTLQCAPESESVAPSADGVPEYRWPPYTLLDAPKPGVAGVNESPQEKGKLLVSTLASFNISARIINISVGPVITRFELQPAQGVRVNRITSLTDDLALALAAPRVRIEAPIPGKAAIGIEVPNSNISSVMLRELVESSEFITAKSTITFALGKDIAGKVMIADLERMPHMLIAGTTGSGKSVCVNDIIISMVYKSAPKDVRMIMIDPKVIELKVYESLPHLLLPVVTDAKKAAGALKWAVMEMDQRYQRMSRFNARDLARYNALQTEESEKLPKIVIIIDELADLMMVAAKDVEESICRIAQLGRAAGIHLIVATQRPSTDVITGLIKANIPSRIAFMVSSQVDSRVILDTGGAEKLLGRGDMLFHSNGASKPVRAQSAFVSDDEVERFADFFSGQTAEPQFAATSIDELVMDTATGGAQGKGKQEDELLPEAVKIVLESGQASISMIQRRLRVGYARAARLIDIMEQMEIVTGFDGSKPRKLRIGWAEYEQMFGGGGADEPNE